MAYVFSQERFPGADSVFPVGEAANNRRDANIQFCHKKLHEIKKNLVRTGGSPLDPPLVSLYNNNNNNNRLFLFFSLQVFVGILLFVELLQFNRKGRSLDLSVNFLKSGTPTKVIYDVLKTMILLILGTESVCNFFLTNVNKLLVYKSNILVYFFFQHGCCVHKFFFFFS